MLRLISNLELRWDNKRLVRALIGCNSILNFDQFELSFVCLYTNHVVGQVFELLAPKQTKYSSEKSINKISDILKTYLINLNTNCLTYLQTYSVYISSFIYTYNLINVPGKKRVRHAL